MVARHNSGGCDIRKRLDIFRPIPLGFAAMAKKLLIITDDAGESLEIYYAQQRFREAG